MTKNVLQVIAGENRQLTSTTKMWYCSFLQVFICSFTTNNGFICSFTLIMLQLHSTSDPEYENTLGFGLMYKTRYILKTYFLENQLQKENNTGNSLSFTRKKKHTFSSMEKSNETIYFLKEGFVQCKLTTFSANGSIINANKETLCSSCCI